MPHGHAIVDGSNIATEGRSTPSLAQLDEAVTAFIEQHDFEHVTVIVDATFGHRVGNSERDAARQAIDDGEIITPPAGVIGRGDAFILEVADRANAVVLSNDSFQEFHGTYDWLFDEGRLIGGKPIPGIGWIFVPRSPVRGPVSRRAVREATVLEPAPAEPKVGDTRRVRKAAKKPKAGPDKPVVKKPTPQATPATGKAAGTTKAPRVEKAKAPQVEKAKAPRVEKAKAPKKRSEGSNSLSAWRNFRNDYPEGSTVAVAVDRFSSHGAYGSVDGVSVYIPLRLLGDPAPRRARDVISLGEIRDFLVHGFDERRRSIDVGIIPFPTPGGKTAGEITEPATPSTDDRGDRPRTDHRTRRLRVAPAKKTPAKKTPAKKTPAKKTPAKKTPAKKAPAKKAPAKKAPAKKAPAKKAPAKKTPAKKAPAKKTPAKKAPAKKRR